MRLPRNLNIHLQESHHQFTSLASSPAAVSSPCFTSVYSRNVKRVHFPLFLSFTFTLSPLPANFPLCHSSVPLEVKFGFGFNQVEVLFSADLIWPERRVPNSFWHRVRDGEENRLWREWEWRLSVLSEVHREESSSLNNVKRLQAVISAWILHLSDLCCGYCFAGLQEGHALKLPLCEQNTHTHTHTHRHTHTEWRTLDFESQWSGQHTPEAIQVYLHLLLFLPLLLFPYEVELFFNPDSVLTNVNKRPWPGVGVRLLAHEVRNFVSELKFHFICLPRYLYWWRNRFQGHCESLSRKVFVNARISSVFQGFRTLRHSGIFKFSE